MSDRNYDGFISYSRHDRVVAARLQRLLEALKPPEARAGGRLRVYLDTEEFSASSSLKESIREALVASEFLIVIASPHSAKSHWVGAEVKIWLGLGRRGRLLFIVAEGDPETLLPSFLASNEESDDLPLAADIRAPNIRASLRSLEQEHLRIAARLFGVGFDDLRQRTVRLRLQRQRRIIAVLAVVLTLVLGAATAAVWQWRVAVAERRSAENRLGEAIAVADRVLVETDRKLQGIPGAETVRLSLVTDATEMLDRLVLAGSERTSLVGTQVEGHLRRGLLAADERDYVQASRELRTAEQLIAKVPTESGRARARTLVARTRGELALARKDYADARRQFELAEPLSREWATYQQVEAEEARADVLRLSGDAKALQRRWAEAGRDYAAAAASYRKLLARDSNRASLQLGTAVVEERLSRVAEVRRDASEVVRRMTTAIQLIEGIAQQELPPAGLVQLAEAYRRLSELGKRWNLSDLAARFDSKALDVTFGLYMTTPQNARYRAALGEAWGRLGENARKKNDFSKAKTLFALQTYMAEILLRQDPTNVALWQAEVESRAALIEMLVEQRDRSVAQEHLSILRRKIDDFARSSAAVRSKDQVGALVQAYCMLGEVARQLSIHDLREQSYRSAFDLAQSRFDSDRDDIDARMDLLVTTANMVLVAAGKKDLPATRERAVALSALFPDEALLDARERELVNDIRKLARRVLDGQE